MNRIKKEFAYEKDGSHFVIETERYGVCGFDIFVTAPGLGAVKNPSYIPFGDENIIMLQDFRYQGERVGIKPPSNIMSLIMQAKNEPTEESEARKESSRKEKEWDLLHNEGGEGYNPFRNPTWPEFSEPIYKGDENLD